MASGSNALGLTPSCQSAGITIDLQKFGGVEGGRNEVPDLHKRLLTRQFTFGPMLLTPLSGILLIYMIIYNWQGACADFIDASLPSEVAHSWNA